MRLRKYVQWKNCLKRTSVALYHLWSARVRRPSTLSSKPSKYNPRHRHSCATLHGKYRRLAHPIHNGRPLQPEEPPATPDDKCHAATQATGKKDISKDSSFLVSELYVNESSPLLLRNHIRGTKHPGWNNSCIYVSARPVWHGATRHLPCRE